MARTFPYIIGPVEGHAHMGVTSAESYLAAQARFMKINRDAGVDVAAPHEATEDELAGASAPFIDHGQWKLSCACMNAPSVSPEWNLACCFECGAIYRDLTFPDARPMIEQVIVERKTGHRNWVETESLLDVVEQNLAHGDRVPDGDALLAEVSDGV